MYGILPETRPLVEQLGPSSRSTQNTLTMCIGHSKLIHNLSRKKASNQFRMQKWYMLQEFHGTQGRSTPKHISCSRAMERPGQRTPGPLLELPLVMADECDGAEPPLAELLADAKAV